MRGSAAETLGEAPPVRDRSNLILLVLCSAAFMALLDVFVVNVAFTAIGDSYSGSELSDLSWVLNGYTIVYAALLIPAGRLADRHGRKAGFIAGVALFSLASLACAFAPSLWWLVAFRVLQAAGAAALTPTSLGLLLTTLPAERRAGAVKIWATSTALAGAIGPVLGGLLVKVSWGWIFLINVPLGVAAIVGAVLLLPETKDSSVTRIPDVLGAVAIAIGFGGLALALVKGGEWGWTDRSTLLVFAVTVAALLVVAIRMVRHPVPIIDPALLRVRSFFWSNVTALLFCIAFGAVLPSVILRLQTGLQYDALITGLAVAPGPLLVPFVAALGQRLGKRMSAGKLVALGNAFVGLGAVLMAISASVDVNYWSQLLPGWMLVGVGVGLALPNLLAKATVDLPPARVSTGSAIVNTSRQLGYVLGVTLLVAILGTLTTGAANSLDSFRWAWWAIATVGLLATLTSFGITTPSQPNK
ncbi:MFS transporter [Kribbella sp. NPDC023855]|uniref:MFS transporter n=1 Tax=Kribbella sp. NPDC023855 TaxID=3154698 RepID=UPI0033F30B98